MATSIDQTSRSIWNKKSATLRKMGFTDVFYILNKDILSIRNTKVFFKTLLDGPKRFKHYRRSLIMTLSKCVSGLLAEFFCNLKIIIRIEFYIAS